jgi:hypothetical protein
MSALACLILSAALAYLIAQFRQRRSPREATRAWRDASELVFDRNLRFWVKEEFETGDAPKDFANYVESKNALVSYMASNLLMLADRRLEIDPSTSDAETFVRQHGDLDDDVIESMWITRLSEGRQFMS